MFDCVEMIEMDRRWAGADVGTCTEPDLVEAAVALETLISLASVGLDGA